MQEERDARAKDVLWDAIALLQGSKCSRQHRALQISQTHWSSVFLFFFLSCCLIIFFVVQPGDRKNPNGKLRLLYEGNPMSFLIEQAGGKSSTGYGRVLDVVPTALHQRCPIFCGSADDITDIENLYKAHAASGAPNKQQAKAKL